MNRTGLIILALTGLILLSACDRRPENACRGKTLKVTIDTRTEQGGRTAVTWTNVTAFRFSENDYGYTFNADGKLVLLIMPASGTLIVEEQ